MSVKWHKKDKETYVEYLQRMNSIEATDRFDMFWKQSAMRTELGVEQHRISTVMQELYGNLYLESELYKKRTDKVLKITDLVVKKIEKTWERKNPNIKRIKSYQDYLKTAYEDLEIIDGMIARSGKDEFKRKSMVEYRAAKCNDYINKRNVEMSASNSFNEQTNEPKQNNKNRLLYPRPTNIPGLPENPYRGSTTKEDLRLQEGFLKSLRERDQKQKYTTDKNVTKLLEQLIELLTKEKNQRKLNDTKD